MANHPAIEEQLLPRYYERQYYPVKIGDMLKDQYRIIAKLGYGAYSTVWLAWDESARRYSSLKVCVQDNGATTSPILNEVSMLERLKNCAAAEESPGLFFTRLADDIFEMNGPSGGRHYCFASKPQAGSLRVLQETFPDAKVPKLLVRSLIHRLFFSVNWLHANCNTIHTVQDITPQNVLSEIEDDTLLKDIEEQERHDSSIPIDSVNGAAAPVYLSRRMAPQLGGVPILTDFGQMRLAEEGGNREWCMPDIYRAPEVLLKLPFSFPVDMWSIGVMTLELMEGKNVFDPIDRVNNQYVLPLALAQYIGFLGPPPLELIRQSPLFSTYFDENGKFVLEAEIPKSSSLEDFVTTIPPGEEREQFLRFIRKLLTWDPESRANSSEIVLDDWLMRPYETMV
ncbi:hypothetical protein EMPG_09662 [Blastomyces silverae]|uniref:non-specific serine/threonine protein kinase n=1 Tax=Blastomyces silverae TaxID=2060906 RepID=A0A0H1BKK7_9EURO|nr:hypothetical protein EMPG_09662 [Blastomyces silverae]